MKKMQYVAKCMPGRANHMCRCIYPSRIKQYNSLFVVFQWRYLYIHIGTSSCTVISYRRWFKSTHDIKHCLHNPISGV